MLSDFMSGDIGGDFSTTSNKFSNTWTVGRVASRRLGIQWIFQDSVPSLVFRDMTLKVNHRRKILFSIRDRLRTSRVDTLHRKKNQGKVLELVSWLLPAPISSLTGLLQDSDQRCRRCGFQQETLAHVLNHCSRYSHAWQLRHNAIVDRLVAALGRRGEILSCNQAVAGLDLRPDIVFKKGTDIFIIDVTCPFENRKSAFSQARANKIAKYDPLLPVARADTAHCAYPCWSTGLLGPRK
ncbi:retrovirus-related Pol polyprotein from type-1 retrotransposable element R2 [Caerostris darwini]|uniref:Retrovirus-related Pol polyprotein from type-1 retrotransposable element R2 n=1 Tax=Caerostris darwini TaxID=1538125 RepID=A0AAV4QP27_9ARAC|nr:retrovirus-related Pol polyprotein from type-1 retrotransposable element R2 [Caerostris darwini]